MKEDILKYVESHSDREPDYLYRHERLTNIRLINGRMCSGHLQGRVLKMLVGMIDPQRALELGTFTGYSALCIAEGLSDHGHLDTVEADDELKDFIDEAFENSPYARKITLHISDALTFIKRADNEYYDFIFIDADKRQYPEYYEECMRVLKPGGYILADNTLWDGHVIEPLKAKDRHTEAIMRFNDIVAADTSVEKVILPIRDGLTIIRKLKAK